MWLSGPRRLMRAPRRSADVDDGPLAALPVRDDLHGVATAGAAQRAADRRAQCDHRDEAVPARAVELGARADRQHEEGAFLRVLVALDRDVEQRSQLDRAAAPEARQPARGEGQQRLELLDGLLPSLPVARRESRLDHGALAVVLRARLALDRLRGLRRADLGPARARDDLRVVRAQLLDEEALSVRAHGCAA